MTTAVPERLQVFLDEQSPEIVDLLLDLMHLLSSDMRALSRLAVRHSGDYADADLPHTLIFQLNPTAKIAGQRIEVRLVSGKALLSLEAGTVGG